MDRIPDTERRMGDLLRMVVVESVDRAAARCVVRVGELLSGPIPWLVFAAGDTRAWSAPTPGEQGILLCPEGEIAAGVLLRGVYSTAFPAPTTENVEAVRFSDGSLVTYDAAAGELVLQLVGKARLVAPEGLSIEADVEIVGDVAVTGDIGVSGVVDAEDDVTVGAISLKGHKHTGVQSGSSLSGGPQ